MLQSCFLPSIRFQTLGYLTFICSFDQSWNTTAQRASPVQNNNGWDMQLCTKLQNNLIIIYLLTTTVTVTMPMTVTVTVTQT